MIVRSKRIPAPPRPLTLAGMLSATSASATAQEATPQTAEFVTPDPAECTVAPRSLESLFAITGTPPPDLQWPSVFAATPGLQLPDEGEPADPATVDAVTAAIHELVACENAGDLLRAYAFFTDNHLWSFEVQEPLTEDERTAAFGGTPVARPTGDVGSVRLVEVRILSGDEVVAVWERQSRFGSMTFVSVLVQQDDRYLIDHNLDVHVMPAGTPPA